MNVQTVKNYVSNKVQLTLYEDLIILYNEALGISEKPALDEGGSFGGSNISSSPSARLLAIANELTKIEKTFKAYQTLCDDVQRFVDWCPSPYRELWQRQYIEGETLTDFEIQKIVKHKGLTAYRRLRYYIDIYNEEILNLEIIKSKQEQIKVNHQTGQYIESEEVMVYVDKKGEIKVSEVRAVINVHSGLIKPNNDEITPNMEKLPCNKDPHEKL